MAYLTEEQNINFDNLDTSNAYIKATLSCSLSSQNITENTSVIHAELRMSRTNDERTWCYEDTTSAWIEINGQTISNCPHFDITYESNTLMVEGDFTVGHNTDGTCTVSIESGFYSSVVTMPDFSGAFDVQNIARTSTLHLPDDSVLGSPFTFTIDRKNSAFVHELTYEFNKTTGTITTGAADTFVWTPPIDLAYAIPDKTVQECHVTCTTLYNGTVIGTHTNWIRLHVPDNIVPVISAVTLSDPNGYLLQYQSYVQSKSRVSVETSAAGNYGSTIKAVTVSVNGKVYNGSSITSEILNTHGTLPVHITVTDSRQRSTSADRTISVAQYFLPQISSSAVWRCKQDGTTDDDGSYCIIQWKDTVKAFADSKRSILLQYRQVSDTPSSYITYSGSFTQQTNGETTSVQTPPIPMSSDHAYTIRITVSDALDSTVKTIDLSTGYTIMDIDETGKKIAFGKVADTNGFEVALPTKISSSLNVTGPVQLPAGTLTGILIGSGQITGRTDNEWSEANFSFGTAFPAPPKVFLQQTGLAMTENMRITSVTATGFTVALYGCSGSVNYFDWIAVSS